MNMNLYATWRDVVELAPQLWDVETRNLTVKTKSDIMAFIQGASNMAIGELKAYYSSLLASAPWYRIPAPDTGNSNPSAYLAPQLTLLASVQTEVLTVTFTSSTAFGVVGDVSGTLATGSTAVAYTATGIITIPTAAWVGTFAAGDRFFISTYLADPTIVSGVVAPLATANLLDSIYTNQIPNSVDTSQKYREIFRNTIKALKIHQIQLENAPIAIDLTPEQQSYYIDTQGVDQTEYNEGYTAPE